MKWNTCNHLKRPGCAGRAGAEGPVRVASGFLPVHARQQFGVIAGPACPLAEYRLHVGLDSIGGRFPRCGGGRLRCRSAVRARIRLVEDAEVWREQETADPPTHPRIHPAEFGNHPVDLANGHRKAAGDAIAHPVRCRPCPVRGLGHPLFEVLPSLLERREPLCGSRRRRPHAGYDLCGSLAALAGYDKKFNVPDERGVEAADALSADFGVAANRNSRFLHRPGDTLRAPATSSRKIAPTSWAALPMSTRLSRVTRKQGTLASCPGAARDSCVPRLAVSASCRAAALISVAAPT
jgi:hypothetical protein